MSTLKPTSPSTAYSDSDEEDAVSIFTQESDNHPLVQIQTIHGPSVISQCIPQAPLIAEEVVKVLAQMNSSNIYLFMCKLITELAATNPRDRPMFITTPEFSDWKVVKIISDMLEDFALEDLLDSWDTIWKKGVAPRLTLAEANQILDIQIAHLEKSSSDVNDNLKLVSYEDEAVSQGSSGGGSDVAEVLLHSDDPDAKGPLTVTESFQKARPDLKAMKKANGAAPFKELSAEMGKTQPSLTEPAVFEENCSDIQEPELEMPTITLPEEEEDEEDMRYRRELWIRKFGISPSQLDLSPGPPTKRWEPTDAKALAKPSLSPVMFEDGLEDFVRADKEKIAQIGKTEKEAELAEQSPSAWSKLPTVPALLQKFSTPNKPVRTARPIYFTSLAVITLSLGVSAL
ncbi:hypothetical protein H072_8293 [Dactylellina haptotyla CBS 200.50]|uniref:Uncharacterized protein n=1 Tax=Dactylellina haptotyla (strain CBS 200.50) TaxID=1284197 RepID=S8AA67_DACHA|nr:hypothetical protein H072_8293 [Dactylellina haptotyla CBS 200.50]